MEDDPPWWRSTASEEELRERQRAAAAAAAAEAAEKAAVLAARDKVRDACIAELGAEGRRWAIWRRYKAGGVTLKKVGEEFGLSPERVRQMVVRCDRKVREALNNQSNNVPNEVRDATLGVEFVFRNEVTFTGWNGDRDGWDQVEPTENGSAYWPPTPEWRTEWGEQDTRPAEPRKVYTYYKTIVHEGADDEA